MKGMRIVSLAMALMMIGLVPTMASAHCYRYHHFHHHHRFFW